MLALRIGLTVLSTILAASLAFAQTKPATDTPAPIVPTPIVVDLANASPQNIRVEAGTYRVVLMNAVVGREYWLQVGPSLPMELPVLQLEPKAESKVKLSSEGLCTPRSVALGVVKAAAEGTVRKTVDQLRIALADYESTCLTEDIAWARQVMAGTRLDVADLSVVMAADTVRRIVISSRAGNTWRVALNTTGRGIWQTTYGVAAGPNRDEEYFSEETGESEFTIRRKPRDEGSLTLLPSVFFTWLTSAQAFRNVQHGPTVGLGVTTGTPAGRFSVLGGWIVRFNQNIGVVGGVSIYPHKRLDGQYEENQVLKESLTSDQLNDDSIRANVFFAFTLRFGSSPFAGAGEE